MTRSHFAGEYQGQVMTGTVTKISLHYMKYIMSFLPRKLYVFLICLCVYVAIYILPNLGGHTDIRRSFDMSFYYQPCQLPELDPFHPEVMEDFEKLPPINCESKPTPVYIDSNNELQFNTTALRMLNTEASSVECKCSSVSRWYDTSVSLGNSEPCGPTNEPTSDFFRIQCMSKGKHLSDDLLTRIHVKNKKPRNTGENEFSVLMFGLDSVSRSMAVRTIPKTFKYLIDTLGGYDIKNYMKVGDNTYPNLVALLTGKFAYGTELPEKECNSNYCDVLPLIWQNFSKKGYTTFYAEDEPKTNVFNFFKPGFLNQPTDHYMRPFWLAVNKLHPERAITRFVKSKSSFLTDMASLVNLKDLHPHCLGSNPNFMHQVNYLKQFLHTYRNMKTFAFSFMTELAHSNQNLLSTADNDFMNFLKWLKDNGHLDNTVVVVFSDHGSRSAQTKHTLRMENSLPLLNIVIPDSLKANFPKIAENLETNRNRLTSTFDLHATLLTILDSGYANPSHYKVGSKVRGMSMFGKIPQQRSCEDANISDHYCVCYKTTPVNISSDTLVLKIAAALVEQINGLLKDESECSVLSLNKIIEARIMSEALKLDHVIRKNFWSKEIVIPQHPDTSKRYTVVIETVPGHAQFHGTAHVDSKDVIEIVQEIDRINKYGTQSHCIEDHALHPFCYCKQQLE